MRTVHAINLFIFAFSILFLADVYDPFGALPNSKLYYFLLICTITLTNTCCNIFFCLFFGRSTLLCSLVVCISCKVFAQKPFFIHTHTLQSVCVFVHLMEKLEMWSKVLERWLCCWQKCVCGVCVRPHQYSAEWALVQLDKPQRSTEFIRPIAPFTTHLTIYNQTGMALMRDLWQCVSSMV